MTRNRRIYLLDPQHYSPEIIAVAFAKTSRSPKPFDEIANELTDEGSAKFHEKWVVGYGHASVAEHAVLHLAMENVSRLAIETIEGNRLASYTEKSTRYQQWDQDAFYVPEELNDHPLKAVYLSVCEELFSTYQSSVGKVETWLRQTTPREAEESEAAFERRIKPAAVDICRFLLPAASLANVGITINARALEYAICKMLSSPLEEVRAIGSQLKKAGQLETPTLIKYAACNDYLVQTREKMPEYSRDIPQNDSQEQYRLISWDQNGEDQILAAILFRFEERLSFENCLEYVRGLSEARKIELVKELMAERGRYDQPLREFEYAQMSFEIVMDQGAYFEFKRHRMMTQTVQPLTADLGFALPSGIVGAGCETDYLHAMRRVAECFHHLAEWNPEVASYLIANGFNRRILFTMNLREAFHFCRLRAAKNAHFSIRRVAHRIAETIRELYPLLGQYLDVPGDETWQQIEDFYFSDVEIH